MNTQKITPELVKNCNKLANDFKILISKGLSMEQASDFLFVQQNKNHGEMSKGAFLIALYIGLDITVK